MNFRRVILPASVQMRSNEAAARTKEVANFLGKQIMACHFLHQMALNCWDPWQKLLSNIKNIPTQFQNYSEQTASCASNKICSRRTYWKRSTCTRVTLTWLYETTNKKWQAILTIFQCKKRQAMFSQNHSMNVNEMAMYSMVDTYIGIRLYILGLSLWI